MQKDFADSGSPWIHPQKVHSRPQEASLRSPPAVPRLSCCPTRPRPPAAKWRRRWRTWGPRPCPAARQGLCSTPTCRRPPLWSRPRRTGCQRTSSADLMWGRDGTTCSESGTACAHLPQQIKTSTCSLPYGGFVQIADCTKSFCTGLSLFIVASQPQPPPPNGPLFSAWPCSRGLHKGEHSWLPPLSASAACSSQHMEWQSFSCRSTLCRKN